MHLSARMPRTPAIAFFLLLACGTSAGPSRTTTEQALGALRVVFWNVHDLFDEVDDPGKGDTVLTHAEVEAKLAAVGTVLARLDGDLLVLAEVENRALLSRLAEGPLRGRDYEAWLEEGFDPRGIDVGLLSRAPVSRYVSHLGDGAPGGKPIFARDLAEVHLATAPPVVVLAAHLASRVDPNAEPRRAQQAKRLAEVTRALLGGAERPVVLAIGDFNDLPGAPALSTLLGDPATLDLGASLPEASGWTWSGKGAHERIDYALLPVREAMRLASFRVESGADVATASDHRPLVVDLWLGETAASAP